MRNRAQIITLSDDPCRVLLKTHRAHLGQVVFAKDSKAESPSVCHSTLCAKPNTEPEMTGLGQIAPG